MAVVIDRPGGQAGPGHVAIVMDGNGRWAERRFLPRIAGHRAGLGALRRCLAACGRHQIHTLTVFAFSSENWGRPPEEVNGLMALLVQALRDDVQELSQQGVRLRFVGDRSTLSLAVQREIDLAEQLSAGGHSLILQVCFNYGGRWDVVQAAQALCAAGLPFTEAHLDQFLALRPSSDPELIIRTGGEQRLSNFLLWQAAYAELVFSDCLWPDFDEADLVAALDSFSRRQRRFGRLGVEG